jgi:hypothetical protein
MNAIVSAAILVSRNKSAGSTLRLPNSGASCPVDRPLQLTRLKPFHGGIRFPPTARRRMALGQKARWAKVKGESAIVAALKKRWATKGAEKKQPPAGTKRASRK